MADDPYVAARTALASSLRNDISDKRVIDAIARVPRHRFIPDDLKALAYHDRPLPIGHGQTISQPRMVAIMLQEMKLEGDEKVLEVGTAAGHMTANLTAFTPPEAVVYSIGVVAEDGVRSGTPQQDYEVPRRDQFARFVNHFGTAHKAQLITADSRTFDFIRLAPLDFAFIDGGHDLATVRSDSLGVYHALRPGGCLVWHDLPSKTPWVEVEKAVTAIGFPEPVYRIAGTEVAFLVKGDGVGATASADSARVAVAWEGEFAAVHSLAGVNRAVCAELLARGHDPLVEPLRELLDHLVELGHIVRSWLGDPGFP